MAKPSFLNSFRAMSFLQKPLIARPVTSDYSPSSHNPGVGNPALVKFGTGGRGFVSAHIGGMAKPQVMFKKDVNNV